MAASGLELWRIWRVWEEHHVQLPGMPTLPMTALLLQQTRVEAGEGRDLVKVP